MDKKQKSFLYLDNAATTPLDRDVFRVMSEYDISFFANPSSLHTAGVQVKALLEDKRREVAKRMQVRPQEIFFTSGGTESNNLALRGVVQTFKKENPGVRPHIIISAIEHASVLDVAHSLEAEGALLDIIPVNSLGLIRPLDIIEKIKPNTVIVSVLYANNEIGVIEPIGSIGRLIREYRTKHNSLFPYFHTDACQATNYLPIDAPRLRADLITLNASKIYGPKGVGILFVRSGVSVEPLMRGGGQERGLRSGTESVSLALGFAHALDKAITLQEEETIRLKEIQNYALTLFDSRFDLFEIHGSRTERLPNNISIHTKGFSGEEMVIRLDSYGIAVSSRSACSSVDTEGSYVILAIGGDEKKAKETIRVTMGRDTKKEDIDFLFEKMVYIMEKYKNINKTVTGQNFIKITN
jgi:cysteine desulfurase